jgi:hypothetical protein
MVFVGAIQNACFAGPVELLQNSMVSLSTASSIEFIHQTMSASPDSPLPKMRKKLPLQPAASSIASPPVSGIIKRSNITATPQHGHSRRSLFLEDEAIEELSDGRSKSSATDDSEEEEEDDADDSIVTNGSYSDGDQAIYQAGQSSQAEAYGFGVPLHHTRHQNRIPLVDALESRILETKNNRRLTKAAAAAAALAAPLSPQHLSIAFSLAAPLSPQHSSAAAAAVAIPAPFPIFVRKLVTHPSLPTDRRSPQRVVIPQSPLRTGLTHSPCPRDKSSTEISRLIVPQTPPPTSAPVAPSPKLKPPSRMKLSRGLTRDISSQTVSAVCSASTQTDPWDAPVTLSDLREEIRTLLVGLGF